MKKTTSLSLFLFLTIMPVLTYAGDLPSTLGGCIKLAPDGQKFSVNIALKADSTSKPIKKTGTFSVSNTDSPNMTEDDQEKFMPLIDCITGFLKE